MADVDSITSQGSSQRPLRNMIVGDGRFILQQRVGSGAFGELYQGIDIRTRREVAIKLEKRKLTYSQLAHESRVYRILHHGINSPIGIPHIYYYGEEHYFNILVMELCGPSLEDLFNYCGRRLSLKTVCMLADQMLQRLEFLHQKGFIHRDIKPENFLFGMGKKGHILQLIDYGLSKIYWDKNKQLHLIFSEGKPLIGTARYCSIWTHQGYEQSRRDDLESISFILIYFLLGSLPWQGIHIKDNYLKTILIGEKKLTTSLEDLCHGLPYEILQYCTYCRNLKFTDQPQYNYLRKLFYILAKKYDFLHSPFNELNHMIINNNNNKEKEKKEEELIVVDEEGDYEIWTNNDNNNNSQHLEKNIKHLNYDWMFDWFIKRQAEVSNVHRKNSTIYSNNKFVLALCSVSSKTNTGMTMTEDSLHVSFRHVVKT